MVMDFDPAIVGIASQPFWLHWQDEGGRAWRHAPDFFVRRADGSGLVVDVRPDDRIPAKDAEVFRMTAMACGQAGWEFRRAGTIDPVVRANIRWPSVRATSAATAAPGRPGPSRFAQQGRRLLGGEPQVVGAQLRQCSSPPAGAPMPSCLLSAGRIISLACVVSGSLTGQRSSGVCPRPSRLIWVTVVMPGR
jgi:hypothetical protein